MELIKVAIADANVLVREGLKRILASETDLLVVGEATNEVEVAAVVERTRPNVLLLDLKIPQQGAVPLLLELTQKNIHTKVLILTPVLDKESILDTAKAGARGYVLECTHPSTLIQVVRKIDRGEIWGDRQVNWTETFVELAHQKWSDDANEPDSGIAEVLSKRELEIVALVADGLSNKEISKKLFIGLHTVKIHLNHVFHKLDVKNRTQAALLFVQGKNQTAPR